MGPKSMAPSSDGIPGDADRPDKQYNRWPGAVLTKQ